MPGLNASLYLGLSGLQAQQSALNVVGQNIANVNTPGYTRQRADLTTNFSQVEGQVYFGTGVSLTSVQGIRDRFLDLQIYRETAKQTGAQERYTGLNAIAGSLADTGSSGIAAQIQAFFQGVQDLSAQPENAALRANLINKAQGMVSSMKSRYQLLDDQRNSADQSVRSLVTEVNTLTKQIANLNQSIMTEATPGANNGARDQRKALTDKLAELVGISVFEGAKGEYQITLDSGAGVLVNGTSSYDLSTSAGGALDGKSSVMLGGTFDVTGGIKEGALGAKLDLRDTILPGFQKQLDELAAGITSQVNLLNRSGYAPGGAAPTGTDFFRGSVANDANGLPTSLSPSAANPYKGMVAALAVNAAVVANPSLIATAGAPVPPAVTAAVGDNRNAKAMASLQTSGNSGLGGVVLGSPYASVVGTLVSDVGNAVQTWDTNATAQQNLVLALQNQRDSISGVNLDEEASSMMTLQRGYQASARFISVINQLTDQLVNQFGK
ncbi:MAG: flagellar hook-associated protein FlgK [Holophagaceae bacterium]|uniref:Flagellar hook-associated protein 1 n=1 Tax=Candidatus Geothrix skivensis TaxID=2954439 RepID=A0A9D7SDV9_9BACT|nr:flagellar hook-associated protein FlgK [Candidatus Geothrix skivensis]